MHRISHIYIVNLSLVFSIFVYTVLYFPCIPLRWSCIRLVLWGERATQFDGDKVYSIEQEESVVARFVGTLAKSYVGTFLLLS